MAEKKNTLEQNPWKTLSDKVFYDNPWIRIHEHQVINPAGNPGIYGVVHVKNIAFGIIPLDKDGNTWIVGQYRYPLQQYSWEICEGGGLREGDHLEAAKRELLEETGILAENWSELIQLHTSNCITDEMAKVYLATGLSFGDARPEETELLQVRKLPFEELYRMTLSGEITDAISVAAVLKLKILLDKGEVQL